MTQKDLKPCRDAFEKWYMYYDPRTSLRFSTDGFYISSAVDHAWTIWQAAWNERATSAPER